MPYGPSIERRGSLAKQILPSLIALTFTYEQSRLRRYSKNLGSAFEGMIFLFLLINKKYSLR